MEVKKFYRTQREVAVAINEIIDQYWADFLTDKQLEENIKQIYENNQEKMIKLNDFTTILKQQCGKNRLAVVSKIINFNTEEITTP
ncbi:TIGR04540 family protein [Aerococcus viridans]